MARRIVILVSVVGVLVSLVVGCDPLGRPSLEPAFGVRVTDGKLAFWTGSGCRDITELGLVFDPYGQDRAEWMLRATDPTGADVEYFTFGDPVPGFEVTEDVPAGFDWRNVKDVRISVTGVSKGGWGTTSYLTDFVTESAEHPDDTYWFQSVGWRNPDEVAAQDGNTFLTTCTPAPPK